jgi:hypothetical protein
MASGRRLVGSWGHPLGDYLAAHFARAVRAGEGGVFICPALGFNVGLGQCRATLILGCFVIELIYIALIYYCVLVPGENAALHQVYS